MSKIKLWENTLFEKIIAVYDDGTEEEIGYIDEDRNRIYYADIPTAHPPRKFRSDWNQRQYDAYQKRNNEAKSRNRRSPDFLADDIQFTSLQHHSPYTSKWVASKISQFENTVRENIQRITGGISNQFAKLQQEQQQAAQTISRMNQGRPIHNILSISNNYYYENSNLDEFNLKYDGEQPFKIRYYNGNPDKPVGTMTLSQANKWYYTGNGEHVYIDFTTIVLPKSVTVERFKKPDFKKEGCPGIYVSFDGSDFVNPNQALVYGTIGIVLIDGNTVMALPDTYDFDIKNQKGSFFRDVATGFGSAINDFAWVNYKRPKPFRIYFRGYQKIPLK